MQEAAAALLVEVQSAARHGQRVLAIGVGLGIVHDVVLVIVDRDDSARERGLPVLRIDLAGRIDQLVRADKAGEEAKQESDKAQTRETRAHGDELRRLRTSIGLLES